MGSATRSTSSASIPDRKGRYHPAGGLRTLLVGVPTQECHGWGNFVHAPLDGEVVAARDGLPERARIHPVRELALVLKTGVTFRPTPEGLHRVLGNHVILPGCDGAYAGFAHLTTGSVAVTPGQVVREGDVIGRVGHTGNSTAPHLHFQLMDGPDVATAKGLAVRVPRLRGLARRRLAARGALGPHDDRADPSVGT